jgi:hypothetical protein
MTLLVPVHRNRGILTSLLAQSLFVYDSSPRAKEQMIPGHKSNESTTYDSCHSRATRGVDILNKVGVYSGKNWSKLETFVYSAQSVNVNIGNLLERTCLL